MDVLIQKHYLRDHMYPDPIGSYPTQSLALME